MTATDPAASSDLEKLSWYLENQRHSIWDQFSKDQQSEMVKEDLFAGKSVSLLLVALISAGLILSAITLLSVLFLS